MKRFILWIINIPNLIYKIEFASNKNTSIYLAAQAGIVKLQFRLDTYTCELRSFLFYRNLINC